MSTETKPKEAATANSSSSSSTTTTTEAIDAAAPPTRDELLELVRAIKFANNEWSQRQVHKEIVETLAKEVACLKDVKLNDVKKVWKKAVVAIREGANNSSSHCHQDAAKAKDKTKNGNSGGGGGGGGDNDNTNATDSTNSSNADLMQLLDGKTPQVFTVGDASQVYPELAKHYTSSRLAAEIAKVDQEMAEEAKTYVHVYLNVPANMSGQAPHQALISFQQDAAPNKPYKKKGDSTDLEIIKIQKAAPLSATDTVQHPMLVYNQARTIKTFIHPEPMDIDDGDGDNDAIDGNQAKQNSYDKISNRISQSGIGGALGDRGGMKAYFYARVTELKKGRDILSIDYTRLAPTQEW